MNIDPVNELSEQELPDLREKIDHRLTELASLAPRRIDILTSIDTIAGQAVRVPGYYALRAALLKARYHLVKDLAARLLGRFVLDQLSRISSGLLR